MPRHKLINFPPQLKTTSAKHINKEPAGLQNSLRVLSGIKPTETAANVPATLEDYYLYVFIDWAEI